MINSPLLLCGHGSLVCYKCKRWVPQFIISLQHFAGVPYEKFVSEERAHRLTYSFCTSFKFTLFKSPLHNCYDDINQSPTENDKSFCWHYFLMAARLSKAWEVKFHSIFNTYVKSYSSKSTEEDSPSYCHSQQCASVCVLRTCMWFCNVSILPTKQH